jgi:hypothetical protein
LARDEDKGKEVQLAQPTTPLVAAWVHAMGESKKLAELTRKPLEPFALKKVCKYSQVMQRFMIIPFRLKKRGRPEVPAQYLSPIPITRELIVARDTHQC